MGRERPLYYIPRYEIIGDKKAGNDRLSLNSHEKHRWNDDLGFNSLSIRNVTLDDDGVYQCQIGRTVEAREVISNFANLTVLIAPDEISMSYVPPGLVISGKEFRIKCEVFNSRPAPIFAWQIPVNSQIVNVSQRSEPMTDNSKLLKSISTLTLIADNSQHGQDVICEATHVTLNRSLTASMMIAVDCQFPSDLLELDHWCDSSYRSTRGEDQFEAAENVRK